MPIPSAIGADVDTFVKELGIGTSAQLPDALPGAASVTAPARYNAMTPNRAMLLSACGFLSVLSLMAMSISGILLLVGIATAAGGQATNIPIFLVAYCFVGSAINAMFWSVVKTHVESLYIAEADRHEMLRHLEATARSINSVENDRAEAIQLLRAIKAELMERSAQERT
jgi:hypothetical protein